MNNKSKRKDYWGISTHIDLRQCNSKIIRSEDSIKSFSIQLCNLLKMKRYDEPLVVNFGSTPRVKGITMIQLIETSNITLHSVDATNNVYIDVFSCKYYNSEKIVEFCKNYFETKNFYYKVLYRK